MAPRRPGEGVPDWDPGSWPPFDLRSVEAGELCLGFNGGSAFGPSTAGCPPSTKATSPFSRTFPWFSSTALSTIPPLPLPALLVGPPIPITTSTEVQDLLQEPGFDCATDVKSTWVPAARRRERHMAVVVTGEGAAAA
ncbi:hypothetical protein AMTR_s00046p00141180, partial [Amborella trichopoda]